MDVIKFRKVLYVLVAISLLSVSIAVIMYTVGQREEMLRKETEKKLASIIQEKEIIESELKKTKILKQKLQEDLQEAEKKSHEFDSRIKAVQLEMNSLKEKLVSQTELAQNLRQQLEEERNKSEDLSIKLADTQRQKQDLEGKFEELKKKKQELETELKNTDKKIKVELDKIVVTSKQNLPGRVLVVNKNYNFIITSLGKDKVLKGDFLGVYRNSRLIGKVRVSKIYANMCSAEITSQIVPIAEGDEVEIIK